MKKVPSNKSNMQDPHIENYKPWMKDFKEEISREMHYGHK